MIKQTISNSYDGIYRVPKFFILKCKKPVDVVDSMKKF